MCATWKSWKPTYGVTLVPYPRDFSTQTQLQCPLIFTSNLLSVNEWDKQDQKGEYTQCAVTRGTACVHAAKLGSAEASYVQECHHYCVPTAGVDGQMLCLVSASWCASGKGQ